MPKKTTTKQSATMTKWLAGEIGCEGLTREDVNGPTRLRLIHHVEEDTIHVQSSLGQCVDFDEVKEILPEVLKALKSAQPDDESSVQLGEYCAEIYPARGPYVKVECHEIDGAEVERIAAVIKAFKPGKTKIAKA